MNTEIMEGFCRGCLIKYDEPMELLQYTEKNRRLFVYSTGLQVKRNDSFIFQLCRDCFLNMKQACKFKKNCRNSDKRFRNYLALKDVGDPVDFCTFLKNNDDTLTFRFPMTSGNSTPATQKCRDDDNESTCTSIRNFMTDILQGEEMPDTEARIIKEVIEEEADVLDDSLDSQWLQDDMSIDTDFRLDFSFSPFSTPRSVNNDPCYTPKQKEEEITFNTINTEKQTKILNDFTNAFKTNDNIEELSIFVGDVSTIEKTEHFKNLKELSPFGIEEIDGMGKSEIDTLKNKQNLKQLGKLDIDEINGMETSDSQIVESNQNLEQLSDFGLEEIDSNNETENNTLESNHNLKELSNFGADEFDGTEYAETNNAVKSNNSLKEITSISYIEEIGKSETHAVKTNQTPNDLLSHFGLGTFGKSDQSNQNLKELCDFSLDGFNGEEKAESQTHKRVQSLKELCDFSLDSIGNFEKPACNINKNNESLKELYNLSLNSFDDTTKSGSGSNTFKTDQNVKELDLSLTDFDDMANSGSNTFKSDRNVKEMCDFGIKGTEKSESNFDLPSLPDVLERDKMDTPDFDIPKGVIGYIPSSNDISNSSINIEAFLKDKPCTIDTNLEHALKNNDSQKFSLEDLLVSPQVFKAESAASTPTISNILFGEKHDTSDSNTKMEQCIEFPTESAASTPSLTNILFGTTHTNSNMEPYHDIQEDIEIFEEFFQNGTKEFNIEDIIRENGGFKSGDWKKPIAVNDVEVNNKENESKSMDIFIEDTNVTESKNEDLIYISHTSPNDKFDIEYLYCKLCKIRYDSSRALSSHLTKLHKIKIEKPKTRNCDKTKPKSGRHIPEIPSNDKFDMKNLYCKLCERKYDTSRALSVHFLKNHNIKIEKPKHTKTRKCDISDTPGTEFNNQAIVYILDTSPNDKFNIEKSYCKLCKKKYNDSRALSIHMSKIHSIKIVKPEYDRKKRKEQLCNNCGMEWKDSSNFARHVKICQQSKDSIFKCDHCLQEFKTKFNLEKHKIGHTNVKRKKAMGKEIECTLCGAIVHGKFSYTLHMRRHTKDYVVNCKYCDKGFYRQSDLNTHMRKHTGDTPFSCTFCTKVFARRDVLLRHIHTHLGEKFFECDYCGLKCVKKSDLINHIQNKSCRRVKKAKKKKKTVKLVNMEIDITEKQEDENVEVEKEVKNIITAKKKNKTDKKENVVIDITEKEEEKVVEVQREVRKIITAYKKIKTDKKENVVIDITDEQEEKVEVKKPKVTVIYAKGSDATIRKQFAFLEPEIKPLGLEEKVKVKKPKVVIYAKGSHAKIRKQLPFLETEIIPQKQEKVDVQKEFRKIKTAKKKIKTDKKENMYIDLTEEQEEIVEVVKYAKGSDAKIRTQLPFFGTEIIPQEKEKVEVPKQVTVIYPKGGDATISQKLPFLETDISN